ncbi:MAG: hypothetical protein V7L04_14125 [Nostoc sp.]|uniref:hypothetical protein n=1 Tax=Nostoc sp. TaxID=1180 RepID=UPI002FF5DFE2
MSQPVTLYSPDGVRSREIAAVDAPGWIKAGWSIEPVAIPPATPPLEEKQELVVPAVYIEPIAKTTKRNDVPRNAIPEN